MEGYECGGFTFYNDFDSANLAKVAWVPLNESVVNVATNSTKAPPEIPDAEFNVWTKPDCCGTEFENGNRTWFYFGIKAPSPCLLVRLNLVDLNRQGKMYGQGMAPVFRIMPGKLQWERIRDKPIFNTIDDIFTLSFKFKTPENVQSVTYFAFTYPFTYTDLQKMLLNIDLKFQKYLATYEDDIYYTKELICRSLCNREVNLLTITSHHGITPEREERLTNLFPDRNCKRPFKFNGKKVIFISARVHPGETPSSFVFNGLLNLLLTREDPVAITLRRLYVFKMIPFLNPDGVAIGHYRTDTRGVNLNRVYLNPVFSQHPPIYAARALIRYYHYGVEKEDNERCTCPTLDTSKSEGDNTISVQVSHMSLEENPHGDDSLWCMKCKRSTLKIGDGSSMVVSLQNSNRDEFFFQPGPLCSRCRSAGAIDESVESVEIKDLDKGDVNSNESGLFLYIDLHGHASKKGIFMYGNHFQDLDRTVECMLLPKLMSINNHNFHFTACNFTERNMYLRDRRDGMSREGSGRVAVLKLTGLTKSYTLECNYNTGRLVNVLPATVKETHGKVHTLLVPPKYTPQVFEEVGKSLGASILDLTGQNPCTRIPNSEFHSLAGLRDWLRVNCANELDETRPLPSKMKLRGGLHNQGKTSHGFIMKNRQVSVSKRLINRNRPSTVPIEKKENMVMASQQPSCSYSAKEQRGNNKTLRLNKKPSKEFAFKLKRNASSDKPKILIRNKLKGTSQKVVKVVRKPTLKKETMLSDQERVKLREICIMKSHEGKGPSGKYKSEGSDDGLTLAWKASSTSQIFTKKNTLVPSKSSLEAGPSNMVHNFSKNTDFPKLKFRKHSLRRLTQKTPEAGKADKMKKRKKLKVK